MSETRNITTLLFDWDGTLADSAPLGLAAFQKAFAELGVPFSQAIYEATYSPNWYAIYEALGLPQSEWQRADNLWRKHYGEQTAHLVTDAFETIQTLRERGYRLGVVTSGTESRVLREIEQAGLGESFQVVICSEHIVEKKPHPEGLELALRTLNCSNASCGYVGDAPEDIEMGRRAGVFTIGVESDYPSNSRLVKANPDLFVGALGKLLLHFPALES